MKSILIAGAGTIGRSVAQWLQFCGDYDVHLVDITAPKADLSPAIRFQLMNIEDTDALKDYTKKHNIIAVISTLPFFCNIPLARFAQENQIHYFDPTEDIEVTAAIAEFAKHYSSAFVPQCGLAPGYIDIIGNDLIQEFDDVTTVKLRCGALPANTANALHYAFTWSPDGLINEYINPCEILENGKLTQANALEGLEQIEIDGCNYEAFNTSGGLATLAQTYQGKIDSMSYKTIRYPGHAEKMSFLLNDMKLKQDRSTLQRIMKNVIPFTDQDMVLIYASVTGTINGRLERKSFAHKYYPTSVFGMQCSAIQLTTTAGICAIVDIVLNNPTQYTGFIKQEQFRLDDFFANRFGKTLKPDNYTRTSHEHPEHITVE